MVALNYARDVRIGDKPARAVALGDRFVWPPLPERLFLRGQSLVYDFVGQKYATRLPDNTIDYTTNVNDLGILTRASTATYWGPSGTLLEAAVDEARIQHDPVTGEPLGVLIEEARTNYEADNNNLAGGMNYSSASGSSNTVRTNLGSTELGIPGLRLEAIADGSVGAADSASKVSISNPYALSAFIKPGSASRVILGTPRVGFNSNSVRATLDLATGVISKEAAGETVGDSAAGGRYVGNGWWWMWLYRPPVSIDSGSRYIQVIGEGLAAGESIEVAGVQAEQGSYPNSYIPTSGSPVTRAADDVSIDLSDVFNPDEGTLRITAQVPEGEVVASLGDRHVISDSSEFKEYDLSYIFHSGNTVAQLGEGIFNKVEYFPAMQEETDLGDLIRTLYGNGEQGAMYIPVPKVLGQQVLYQDAAGTMPVESDGDPVGLMLDLSGNGNHATQETSAARPTYKGLVYDGVDDWIHADQCVLSGTQRTFMFAIDTETLGENSAAIGWGPLSGSVTTSAWLYVRTTFGSANEQVRMLIGSDEVLVGPDLRNTGTRTVGLRQNGTNWDLLIDGDVYVSANYSYEVDMDGFTLGRSNSDGNPRWLSGKLGGFVASDNAWADAECKQVSYYLLAGGDL